MEDDRLLKILLNQNIDDDEALGLIFSNYIDLGGTLVGLTVENAVKAGRLLRRYDKIKSKNENWTA